MMQEIACSSADNNETINVVISFRGEKVELTLPRSATSDECTSIAWVKSQIISTLDKKHKNNDDKNEYMNTLQSHHIKLLYKGKVLKDEHANLIEILVPFITTTDGDGETKKNVKNTNKVQKKSTFRLVAMGTSPQETLKMDEAIQTGIEKSKRLVRDDLTKQGQQQMKQRQRLGRKMLKQAAQRAATTNRNNKKNTSYGFGQIQVLPNLPQQDTARTILSNLANDPGILACMEQHHWMVPTLSELYPKGKVGESEICVMGLNRNQGQEILLRIRTDDLQGFRKSLSIRKVLYHELAHNVHSEHDTEFYKLMRQIEKECEQGRRGRGIVAAGEDLHLHQQGGDGFRDDIDDDSGSRFTGGTYRLGKAGDDETSPLPGTISGFSEEHKREVAARAALARLSAEEQQIQQNCGCGREHDMFLPPQQQQQQKGPRKDENDTKQHSMGDDPMDDSS